MLNDVVQKLRNVQVKKTISEHDRMYSQQYDWHYFSVGRSALTAITTALCARLNYCDGNSPIKTVLDFGCGYGRVARYLKAAFPSAHTYVTDIDQRGVSFCVSEFDCIDARADVFAGCYDLIRLGSVFTHLPEPITEDLIGKLTACLEPNGLFVFTSQGRFSAHGIEHYLNSSGTPTTKVPYNLSCDSLFSLLKSYYKRGYGFANYPNQQGYGIALASPLWFQERIISSDKFLQILWQEKGWDAHQDVNAFIRAKLEDRRKSNF